jgi:hypothetical protein
MDRKGLLNMTKLIHAPLSRIIIIGFIVFGMIVVFPRVSSSNSSPSSPGVATSEHPFQPRERVLPDPVRTYNYQGKPGTKEGARPIRITSIVGDKALNGERTCVVYTLRDNDGAVRYVGITNQKGTPSEAMAKRLSGHRQISGHAYFEEARIELLLSGKRACLAAEDIMREWYERNGAQLNNIVDPLGSRTFNYDPGLEVQNPDPGKGGRAVEEFIAEMGAVQIFASPEDKKSLNAAVSSEGSMPEVLSGPERGGATQPAPGGIDFSTLELRYIAEDSGLFADRGLRYAFNATPSVGNKNLSAGRLAAVQASDAFFVWLSLSPEKFWVNLNPSQPDRIIDPQLARTDAGRILLQSDFQMKKTIADLIHPDTSLGKQYWQAVSKHGWQQRRNGLQTCPPVFRMWISPSPATVHEDNNGIYIVDAPLKVDLDVESLNFGTNFAPQNLPFSCTTTDKSTRALYESLYRKFILPGMVEAVNAAPEYADLRRVYRSRVAAEWYRQRSTSKATTYRNMVNNGDVSSWPARQDWSPRQVFNQYVNSVKNSEFRVTRKWQEGNMLYTEIYVYGGVDFAKIIFNNLTSTDFQRKWGDLRPVVNTSMKSPVADRSGRIWLGGSSITGRSAWKTIWYYLLPGLLVSLLFLIRWRWKRLYRRG